MIIRIGYCSRVLEIFKELRTRGQGQGRGLDFQGQGKVLENQDQRPGEIFSRI